ncbi:MAG: MFS transporter [Pseudoxanthomonas sp.]
MPIPARSEQATGMPPPYDADEGSPIWRRVLFTAVLGNVVEWYDHALYGILAVFMSRAFFADDNDPYSALIATYIGLIASYAIRPIGGVVMGRLSDVRGHRFTLVLTIALMTVGTVLIGVIPGYTVIGVAAPLLLMLCRLVQGVGASGEYTVAANFILEHGPRPRRHYLAGWSVGSTSLGPLLASVVSLALIMTLPEHTFAHWGWRIPFLLAAPLGLITLYIRRSVPELPRIQQALEHVQADAPPPRPFTDAVREQWRRCAR